MRKLWWYISLTESIIEEHNKVLEQIIAKTRESDFRFNSIKVHFHVVADFWEEIIFKEKKEVTKN